MRYHPDIHHRRSIRLRGYDYRNAGAYYVTLVTHDRECLFGEIAEGEMRVNDCGRVVVESWQWLSQQYYYVDLDEWIIMPNHLHGIIVIVDGDNPRGDDLRKGDSRGDDSRRGGSRTALALALARTAPTNDVVKRKSLGRLIGAFKTVSTKNVNILRQTPEATLWQRNYYEHIVRDENDLNRIRDYIVNNPSQWATDNENPNRENATRA